jgi:hypothetical protein
MGTAVSTSNSSVIQTAVNRTFQTASNACTATCNQLISGNVIVLDNSTAGDITFTQRCTADASCYMTNALEQAVTTFQGAKAEAGASPAMFPGIQLNVSQASTQTDITNELTQIMENLCTADVNQTVQDNIIYATDSTVGNIGFLQEGNASARCVMENSGRLQLQMRQEGDATAKAGGAASIIGAIIALVIVVVIVIFVMGKLKKNTSEQAGEPGADGKGTGTGQQKKTGQAQGMLGNLQGMMGGKSGATGAKTSTGTRSASSLKSVRR